MATTTVISQIAFTDDQLGLHVKGTVGGVAYQTTLKNNQDNLVAQVEAGTANAPATAFLAKYTNYAAAVAAIASATINYHAQEGTGTNTAIVFGSTPVVIVGYDYLEITATVGGTSTVLHLSQDLFLEYSGNGDLNQELGRRFVQQNSQNSQIAAAIATFSI